MAVKLDRSFRGPLGFSLSFGDSLDLAGEFEDLLCTESFSIKLAGLLLRPTLVPPAEAVLVLILSLVRLGLDEPMPPPLRRAGDPLAGDLAASTELDLEPGLVYRLEVDLDLVRPPPESFLGDLAPPLLFASNNFLVSLTVSGAGNSRSLTPNNNPAETGFIEGCLAVIAGPVPAKLPTLCLPVRAVPDAGLKDLNAATDCLANNAADFFAGKIGELFTVGDISMFSLTRAGVEESTWFTGGGGGSTLDSLGGRGGGDTLGGRTREHGSKNASVKMGFSAALLRIDRTSTL